MNILAVLSQKGGTGKSHSVRSLAVAALLTGKRVRHHRCRSPGDCRRVGQAAPAQRTAYRGARQPNRRQPGRDATGQGAELIVIDTPPHAQPIINMAAEASTSCLIVTGAFLEELETVASVATIAKSLKKPSAIVLNRVSRSHALTLARTALGTFRLPVCPVAMAQLVTHAYASAEGETANEREPNGKAAEEVNAVFKWLVKEGLI